MKFVEEGVAPVTVDEPATYCNPDGSSSVMFMLYVQVSPTFLTSIKKEALSPHSSITPARCFIGSIESVLLVALHAP